MNLKDLTKDTSPEVLVQGIGRYSLEQAKKSVQGKLRDLANRADQLVWDPSADPQGWETIQTLLNKQTLQAFLDAVVQAGKQPK